MPENDDFPLEDTGVGAPSGQSPEGQPPAALNPGTAPTLAIEVSAPSNRPSEQPVASVAQPSTVREPQLQSVEPVPAQSVPGVLYYAHPTHGVLSGTEYQLTNRGELVGTLCPDREGMQLTVHSEGLFDVHGNPVKPVVKRVGQKALYFDADARPHIVTTQQEDIGGLAKLVEGYLPGIIPVVESGVTTQLFIADPDFTRKYKEFRFLGRGGQGLVLRAKDGRRKVAIKLLNPEITNDPKRRAAFEQEADTMKGLDHPNVVRVWTDGYLKNPFTNSLVPYVSLEWVEDGSLDDMLKAARFEGRSGRYHAMRMFEGVAKGLQVAHENGVVHRDIKPANILLYRDPERGLVPKITDFGLAGSLEEFAKEQAGTLFATPVYAAPEQILQTRDYDARVDRYALGVMLFRMFNGKTQVDKTPTNHLPTTSVLRYLERWLNGTIGFHFTSNYCISETIPGADGGEQLRLTWKPETDTEVRRIFSQYNGPPAPQDIQDIIVRCSHPDRNKRYTDNQELLKDLRAAMAKHRPAQDFINQGKTMEFDNRPAGEVLGVYRKGIERYVQELQEAIAEGNEPLPLSTLRRFDNAINLTRSRAKVVYRETRDIRFDQEQRKLLEMELGVYLEKHKHPGHDTPYAQEPDLISILAQSSEGPRVYRPWRKGREIMPLAPGQTSTLVLLPER